MRPLWFFLAILSSAVGFSIACPSECNCFGWAGIIADCARKDLTSVTFADFDAETIEIHMQYNNIEELDPMTFANVPKLKHLYLQSNKISTLPDGIFDNLPELQTIRLNHNRVSDIGENKFKNLKSLILLYLHNNDIKVVNERAFDGAENLEQISVADNPNLVDIGMDTFVNVTNLTMIDISGSAVKTMQVNWFQRNEMLEKAYSYGISTLNCSDAALWNYVQWMNQSLGIAYGGDTMLCAEPENVRGRSVLVVDPDKNLVDSDSCPEKCVCIASGEFTIVDCSSRNLTSTPVGFPPQTTEIFLQNNKLTKLGSYDFLHLSRLEYLYLHDNEIATWDKYAFSGAARTLKQLTLNNNRLGPNIIAGVFEGMNLLEIFGMDNNSIKQIPSNSFSDMTSVVQFSMQNNQIEVLPQDTFATFASLKYVGLANNLLRSISDTAFVNSPNLHMIDVAGNKIEAIPKIPPSTVKFIAENSNITEILASTFQEAANLDELSLSGNMINVVEKDAFEGAPNLQGIDLSNNAMQEITDKTFSSANALLVLNLGHNSKLTRISQNAFQASRKTLLRLYLNDGGLTTMSSNTLKIMENPIFMATLSGNPWNCECDLQDLAMYISNSDSTDEPTCSSPMSEKGKELPEVTYCYEPGPEDENKALAISLSIVGAVLVFCVVMGVLVWKSKKTGSDMKYASVTDQGTRSTMKISDNSNEPAYENAAYENEYVMMNDPPVSEL